MEYFYLIMLEYVIYNNCDNHQIKKYNTQNKMDNTPKKINQVKLHFNNWKISNLKLFKS